MIKDPENRSIKLNEIRWCVFGSGPWYAGTLVVRGGGREYIVCLILYYLSCYRYIFLESLI